MLSRGIRFGEWGQNLLVFAAVAYSLQLTAPEPLVRSILAFCSFCAVSAAGSSVGNVNRSDAHGRPDVRTHPLGSRSIVRFKLYTASALFALGIGSAAILGITVLAIAITHAFVAAMHQLLLKKVLFIDAFATALGLALIVLAGAVVVDVPASPWLYTCTMFGSLFVSFANLQSGIKAGDTNISAGRWAAGYTIPLLDSLIAITGTAAFASYSLYTFISDQPSGALLMATIPVVLYGIFRYLYVLQVRHLTGNVIELLLNDLELQLAVVAFVVLSFVVLYLWH